jgi:hypothetical protein
MVKEKGVINNISDPLEKKSKMRKGISYKKIAYLEHLNYWSKVVTHLEQEYRYQKPVTFKK